MINSPCRIGVYYTHYQCLGHTTRVLTLLSLLKEKRSSFDLSVIQGSRPQKALKFPDFVKSYTLPYSFFNSSNFLVRYKTSSLALEARRRFLLNLNKKINPDVFITEYFPLGRDICKYELLPTLYYLRKQAKKIISSVGYPVISGNCGRDLGQWVNFYHRIFIHTPPLELDYIADSYKGERDKYLATFKRHDERITFTGYLMPFRLDFDGEGGRPLAFPEGKIRILVTRGAGAYYANIIATSIKASDLLGKDFHFIIIAGPSTNYKDWVYFEWLMRKKSVKNATLIHYTSNMGNLIKDCDLVVSPASYNTAVFLLFYKKKAVVIPFRGYGNMYYREQPARARLLRDFLGSRIIEYCRLTARGLGEEIIRRFGDSCSSGAVDKNWFAGRSSFWREFSALTM